jgi:Glycosyltransferase family 87
MHDATLTTQPNSWVFRMAALACVLIFLVTGFRRGFERDETDFPNYYTAAVLVRKGAPLRKFYDWTWFAREMDRAGLGRRIGSYTPQTPLTMLPMVGLAGLSLQRAKQVWLILNLFFLMCALGMLSQITRWAVTRLWLVTFCGYYALNANFILGQYYVFLLLLLVLTIYLLHHDRPWAAGAMAGVAFALKLYGGPYLLFFVASRKWKAVAGMVAAMSGSVAIAISIFGWRDVQYYLLQLLPRFLESGAVDPYNIRNQTMSTLLRRLFLLEPQLNPHPLWNIPAAFFFARALFTLTILLLLYLGTRKTINFERDFVWYVVAVLLLSTNLSSYTFILLLLPVVFLQDERAPLRSAFLAASCLLLSFPLHWPGLFPKMWLLLGLFVVFGWERWRNVPLRSWAFAAAAVLICSALISWKQMRSYREEPGQRAQQFNFHDNSLFSSFPVITSSGLFFQSMEPDRYVVRWVHHSHLDEISSKGNAFHPIPLVNSSSVAMEDSYLGSSTMIQFDPSTKQLTRLPLPVPSDDKPPSATSPDGHWLAYGSNETGFQHLWLRNLATGQQIRIAGGNCESAWPAWELDSHALVFASDCGRAVGLPMLYRVEIPVQ